MKSNNLIKIGFTGSRNGGLYLFEFQRLLKERILFPHGSFELHHGDCVGCDAQAHYSFIGIVDTFICIDPQQFIKAKIVVHPPIDNALRAYSSLGNKSVDIEILEPKNYLERDRDIVDVCDVLIACPNDWYQDKNNRSGTWYTVKYALKKNKTVYLMKSWNFNANDPIPRVFYHTDSYIILKSIKDIVDNPNNKKWFYER